MKKTPSSTNPMSGMILTKVIPSISLALLCTPRTFAITSSVTVTTTMAFGSHVGAEGTSAVAEFANATATAAPAAVPVSSNITPAMNPTNGPSATSTYAYGPPVMETRLPASAKHNSTNAMITMQTKYASGAAPPSIATAVAGSAKIPLPTV